MAKKRGNNEGSIYRRKNGTWAAQYTVWTAEGRKRRSVSGKTRAEVSRKLTEAMADRDGGFLYEAGKLTISEYLDCWLVDSVKGTVKETTYANYAYMTHKHISPALGHVKLKTLTPAHVRSFYREKARTNLSNGRGWVVGASTKSGQGRRVRLTRQAASTLKDHRKRQLEERLRLAGLWQDQGLVFPNETGSLFNPSNLRNRSFKRIKARANVREDLRFHDLRHTCATLLLSEGVNVKVVSELLGHASITITLNTYAHVLPDMQDSAADAMEAALS